MPSPNTWDPAWHALMVSVVGPTALAHRWWADVTQLPAKVRKARAGARGQDELSKKLDIRGLESTEIPMPAGTKDPHTTVPTFHHTKPNPGHVPGMDPKHPDYERPTKSVAIQADNPHRKAKLYQFRRFEVGVTEIPGWTRLTVMHPFIAAQQETGYTKERPVAGLTREICRLRVQQYLALPLSAEEIDAIGAKEELIVLASGFGDELYVADTNATRWMDALNLRRTTAPSATGEPEDKADASDDDEALDDDDDDDDDDDSDD